LTNRKGLAKSSSTPGKTQLINYFEIKFKTDNEELPYLYARFVDLPGFGYAKVAKSLKAEWNRNLTAYLEQRPNLQIFVHLIDSRHPQLEIDKNVNEFLKAVKRGDQIIVQAFTKTDKLTQNELGKLKRDYPEGIFISNLKKKGMMDLQNKITGYLFGH
jgi:GTP-binding protein